MGAKELVFVVALLLGGVVFLGQTPKAEAACTPTTDYGTVTSTVSITTAGTYRTWVRIMAPDTTNNSLSLEVDGGSCIVVGNNTAIPANTWTWVDYRDGTTTSKINLTLTAASHTIKLIGTEPGVSVDRVILTTDTACVPTGTGDNCANPVTDTSAPTVSFTFPGAAAGETLTNDTIVIASLTQPVVRPTLSDNVGVTSSAYKLNGTAISLTSGQYTLPNQNGDYLFNVVASDAVPNTLNKTITVKTRSADIVRDGHVNNPDFVRMLTRWGTTDLESDLDVNGVVGQGDFTKLLIKWTN